LLGARQISISNEGIRELTEVTEVSYSWAAVTEVLIENEYIVIFVQGGGGIIIPKRDLDPGTYLKLREEITSSTRDLGLLEK